MQRQFFQTESKFVRDKCYETLEVDNPYVPGRPIELSDEYGTIRPGSIKYVGKYISSFHMGVRDSHTIIYEFLNDDFDPPKKIRVELNYDGSTRFREVNCLLRLPISLSVPLPEPSRYISSINSNSGIRNSSQETWRYQPMFQSNTQVNQGVTALVRRPDIIII